jgi:protein-disulfide isomerase
MKAAIIASIIFCAALIGVGVYYATKPQVDTGPRTVPISQSYTDRVSKGYWVDGDTEASPKVTVVEYADFQCPYCQALAAPLSAAIDQSSDYVQLQYHSYPLSQHNKAIQAAHAAEAAGRQGKFWQMHDELFAKQSEWEDETTFDFSNTLDQYAKDQGLDVSQFDRDLNDPSLQTPIDADMALADKIPLTGTPTLVVNGTLIANVPNTTDGLLTLFQNARDGKPLQ